MAKLVEIEDLEFALSSNGEKAGLEKARGLCEELEKGNILFFPKIPFNWPPEDIAFFTEYNSQEEISIHKIKERTSCDKNDEEKLCRTMKHFSQGINTFLGKLLIPYSTTWQSYEIRFRPKQIQSGKKNSLGVIHTDQLPPQSINGDRKLCFYINFSKKSKKWITADSFSSLINKYAKTKKQLTSHLENRSFFSSLRRKFLSFLKKLGLPVSEPTPYEQFMSSIHRLMKTDKEYQNKTKKDEWELPSLSCWMFFSDSLAHTKLHGDSFLEQSFIVPCDSLLNPETSPISLLERLTGHTMSAKQKVTLSEVVSVK